MIDSAKYGPISDATQHSPDSWQLKNTLCFAPHDKEYDYLCQAKSKKPNYYLIIPYLFFCL